MKRGRRLHRLVLPGESKPFRETRSFQAEQLQEVLAV